MSRGRPRKTDPDKALETAMKLFWKQGFEGTSMNDLAAATGMAKPGLYATFGDKEAVYSKALEHYFQKFGSPMLEELLKRPHSLDTVIRHFLLADATSACDKKSPGGCFLVNSVIECSDQSATLEDLGRTLNKNRREALLERFRSAISDGELPMDADPRALADFFAGQALALSVMGRGGSDRKSLERFIDVAMTALPAIRRQ